MLKKIIIFFVFCFYWGVTIFFTIPENYLQIKSIEMEKIFSSFFYQKWSFFAPPPKFNDRLYYQFVNKKDTLLMEVIEPIHNERRKQYLVNNDISIVDYILSNSLNNISDVIREKFGNYKFLNCKDKSEGGCFKLFLENFDKDFYSMNEINTLKNYGLSLVKRKKLDKFEKMKIIYTSIKIPKFSKRNLKSNKEKEQFIFDTKYFDLKSKLWEK